jgi:hypothetical protein
MSFPHAVRPPPNLLGKKAFLTLHPPKELVAHHIGDERFQVHAGLVFQKKLNSCRDNGAMKTLK